jgi:hypothetical protein
LSNHTHFLTVIARVSDAGVELFPGFTTSAEHRVEPPDRESRYAAELVGQGGRVLNRHPLVAQSPCVEGQPTDDVVVMGKVPAPRGALALRIVRDQETLLEREFSSEPPNLELTWRPPDVAADRVSLSWEASHPAGLPLWFIVVYDHIGDGTWNPVSFVTPLTVHEVDLAHLPGGARCRFGVLCSDGFNTVHETSEPFALPARPCQAFIVSPIDGQSLSEDAPLTLHGQGYWLEEDRPEMDELDWWSSLDGALGYGSTVPIRLRRGSHTITLRAGHGNRTSTASVSVNVNASSSQPEA